MLFFLLLLFLQSTRNSGKKQKKSQNFEQLLEFYESEQISTQHTGHVLSATKPPVRVGLYQNSYSIKCLFTLCMLIAKTQHNSSGVYRSQTSWPHFINLRCKTGSLYFSGTHLHANASAYGLPG